MQAKQVQQLVGAFVISDITKRPPFLLRNIDQRLHCDKDKRPPRPKFARLERENFDPRGAAFLTEMAGMNERLTPKLKVTVKGVAPGGRRSTGGGVDKSGHQSGGVRGRGNVIDVRCRLRLAIYSRRNTQRCLHETHRVIRLHGERRLDGKFELATTLTQGEAPFEFHMDLLKDIVENEVTWREAMAEDYLMRFEFDFSNPQQANSVWAALGIDASARPQNGMFARWDGLPRCPAANKPLALFASKDTTTHYALTVSMGWGTEEWLPSSGSGKRRRTSTPLEAWNMSKRQKTNGQLPTPVSTPRSGTSIATTDVTLRWHINGQLIEKHGFQCILCGGRDLRSLDKVEVHLVNSHACLEFTIDTDQRGSAVDEAVVDIMVVNGSLASKPTKIVKTKLKGAVEKEDSVIGDFEYTTTIALQTDLYAPLNTHQVLRDPRFTVVRGRKAKETPPPPLPAIPTPAPASDIQLELPTRMKRRVPVAQHPTRRNVRFLSSDNKAALAPGEMLSDEDDDIDEAHLLIARRVEMAQQLTDGKERRFLLDINTHIDAERPHGDIYLGPCLRRWMHRRRAWLADPETAKMFELFVRGARRKEYVSEEVFGACMDVLKQVRGETGMTEEERLQRELLREEGETVERRRGRDECRCGMKVDVARLKTRVGCANLSCAHPEHHTACILNTPEFKGKAKLPRLWYCGTCLESVRTAIRGGESFEDEKATLPSAKDLLTSAENFEEAKEHWEKVLEEHGCTTTGW